MTNIDLLLDSNNDLVIEGFDLQLTSNKISLGQLLKQRLKSFKGDWFLDINEGMPYYEDIIGQRNSVDAIRAIFTREIRQTEGVKDIVSLDMSVGARTRTLNVSFVVLDELGNNVNVEL